MIRTVATEPLRAEHRDLLPKIERLREVADEIGIAPFETTFAALADLQSFLATSLVPHARAEEAVLYPEVARLLGAAEATMTMSRDHEEVLRLIAELAALREMPAEKDFGSVRPIDLRRILYGLYALIKTHFAKEEDVFLPILDAHLTTDDARVLFGRMERAALEVAPRS
jgi:iron-sulfur cluster repair protein YtfE (RIC family)